ncbi:MAG TPA: TonB-dependent receptor [Vicinamibacterales bacterium]|nr:TonB-dependent receptor [Vicinamibacterales bacterium]
MLLARRLVFGIVLTLSFAVPALAQQRGSIGGKVIDAADLPLPGATITVTEQNTGFTRTVVTAAEGAYSIPNLEPGTYSVTVEMTGFATIKQSDLRLTSGLNIPLDIKMQVAGLQEQVTVTGQSPLVETKSSQIGGTLSSQEIEDVPSNFRNFTALTQLIPGITPNPAASTFEGGQVVANGTPSQQNVYLLDGMYNNDDRLGGSQGTQVRVVLDNIQEYQVLSNSYSAEYGGGAGAIINMVTRGGTNDFNGRVYAYFRDDKFNARNALLPETAPKPEERTLQSGFGVGGPIIRDRAHFYFTLEHDSEQIAGFKRFPAEAAPLATDMVGEFTVDANNYFARGDLQLTNNHFMNVRWLLETAPTKGEGFNTNDATIDAQTWESDWDHMISGTFTSVLGSRASNVIRVGRIGEELATGAQTYFDEDVKFIGFAGRDPLSIGQLNDHASYLTGKGGSMVRTVIRTYVLDESFSYFMPGWGGEHNFKTGGGISFNEMVPRTTVDSGTFLFRGDAPYNPAVPSTYPYQFDITLGPPGANGFDVFSEDRRYYFFAEDKWSLSGNLTLNLGVRYDHHRHAPNSKDDFGPRLGFAWDVRGDGRTVVRGGAGKFYSYVPVVHDLTLQQQALVTLFPVVSVTDPNSAVLRPDMITDSSGNPGVATLSPAGAAELNSLRASTYNRNPRFDSENRQMPYQWSWSLGVNHQLGSSMAVGVDYVANASRDQLGVVDINEPVNGVRPGVNGFDPTGELIPPEARNVNYQRVLVSETRDEFDGNYQSVQFSFLRRMANRWSARAAYTIQESQYVGIGNPDARRVWLDDDIRADYGRFISDRRHVLAVSGSINPWRTLTFAGVLSAISGAPINETVGSDVNRDNDNTDRPIRGVNDLTRPILSELDDQGRAVINGLDGPESVLLDVSLRYQVPFGRGIQSVDLFYDVFNLLNRTNYVAPTGNRASPNFMIPTAAQFPRQMQFGLRVRF